MHNGDNRTRVWSGVLTEGRIKEAQDCRGRERQGRIVVEGRLGRERQKRTQRESWYGVPSACLDFALCAYNRSGPYG